jgi:O-antigen ligase
MTSSEVQQNLIKIIFISLSLTLIFIFGIIFGFSPLIVFIFIASICSVFAYFYSPSWFAYLFIFILSFAGLLHLPITKNGFSSAVAIAIFSFGSGIFGALITKDRNLVKIFSDRIEQIFPILFFMLTVISMMNSKELALSVKQVQQFFYVIIIYYFLQLIIRNRETFRRALFILSIGGFCVGILGLVEVITQTPIYNHLGGKSLLGAHLSEAILIGQPGRISGVIGDAAFHGIYMTIIAAVSLYFFFTSQRLISRILYSFVFFISILNIMGTGSRAAFLALLVALFLFWALARIPHKSAIMTSALLTGATIVLIMVFLVPHFSITRSFTYSEETSTIKMRWENIPVAINMFSDHPIIGNGPDGFVINYNRYASGLTSLAYREKTLKTHNTPLQILAEYGLLGITFFSLIIFLTLNRMVTIMRTVTDPKDHMIAITLIVAISAYILFMMTSNTLLDKYFWLLIALAQIHYSICRRPTTQNTVYI